MWARSFQNNFVSFVGAIRQLKINKKLFPAPSRTYEAKTCSPTEEVGSFFYADGGHIKLSEYGYTKKDPKNPPIMIVSLNIILTYFCDMYHVNSEKCGLWLCFCCW